MDDQPTLGRREVFGVMGIAAASATGGNAWEAVAAQPAPNVEDRTSAIRLAGLQAVQCRDRVFVKLTTNHGIHGWGEIKGVIPSVAKALVTSMYDVIKGINPTRIEHIWQILYRAERNQRGGAFMVHCIAGLDMALWDIAGKLWGVPVYRLLGGRVRDKMRVYPSAKAIKIGSSPQPQSGNPSQIEALVNRIKQARKKVGRDGSVMFDAHSAIPPAMLIQLAAAIQPYEILFLEEPAVTGSMEVFKRLKEQIRIPLAAGERDRTIWGIAPYLVERALDVVQPDCGYTGGISQMKKIVNLAEAFSTPIAPHCTQSYLGMTASFHVTATAPLFLIHESYDNAMWGRVFRPHWTKKDGHVSIPAGTGLCIDVDEKAMEKLAKDPNYKYRWRGPHYNYDGSVTDY